MKTHNTLFLLLILLLLAACGGKATSPAGQLPAAPTVVAQSQEQQSTEGPGEMPASPSAGEASATGGPGSFDLPTPEAGLEQLSSYHAVLEMTFDGKRQGQEFRLKRSYSLDVDRGQDARLLRAESIGVEGQASAFFAGQLGPVRYLLPALDAPCQASLAAADPGEQIEPARLLPRLIGAEAAGEETLGGFATHIYQFDQRALGAGEQASASGKLWVAQEGGWVIKYELSMNSETVFGEGVTGTQHWIYTISDVNVPGAALPESCPQPLVDMPVPPDAAGVARMPDSVQFQTGLTPQALEAFYAEQLPALGWAATDNPPDSEGLWRWVFTRQASQGQMVAMISAKTAGSGLSVHIYQVQTEAGAAQ